MTREEQAKINEFIVQLRTREMLKRLRRSVSGPETLDAAFLGAMQEIGLFGMVKHPTDHYKLHEERPQEDGRAREMLSHALEHMTSYKFKESHELGDCRYHLAAAAFNIMMEFYFFTRENKAEENTDIA
jgi:hypothetical protein